MSIADEIAKLERLRADGTLSEAEFEAAKQKALSGASPSSTQSESGGIASVLWVLVIVIVVAAGAVLFALNDISEELKLITGGVGVVAAAAGSVMGMMEEVGTLGILAFVVLGLAIGAVAFLAVAPIVVPIVLAVAGVGALWAWFGGGLME